MTAKGSEDRFTIYRLTNAYTDKAYIGMTSVPLRTRWYGHEDAARKGAKTAIARAIRKYGAESFFMDHVASSWSWDEAAAVERIMIAQENSVAPNGYNITTGGDGSIGVKQSKETVAKRMLALAAKPRRPRTPEEKAALSERLKSFWSPERRAAHSEMRKKLLSDPVARAKLSAAKKAVMTDEYKAKISKAHKGRKFSLERRITISKRQRGRIITAEHKARISAGLYRHYRGHVPSERQDASISG